MREYAAARLEDAGEVAAVRTRHRDFVVLLAEEVFLDPELGGPDAEAWAHSLRRMQGDLRAALEWCVVQKEDRVLLRLAAALGFFWARFAFWQEGQDWLERVLAAAPPEPSRERADALYYAGMVAWYRGDRAVAERRLDEALSLFRAVGDARDTGVVLNQRAISAYTAGDYAGAIALLDESIALLRGQDLPEYLAYALYLRGIVARIQGDFAQARTLGEESLRLSETGPTRGWARRPRLKFVLMSDRRRMANILDSLGVLALYQGHYAEARTRSEAALTIAREDEWFFMIVSALNTLSLIAARTGQHGDT
jgi:non-specific serine/threonine protein kinase